MLDSQLSCRTLSNKACLLVADANPNSKKTQHETFDVLHCVLVVTRVVYLGVYVVSLDKRVRESKKQKSEKK